jgi:hypothetical protein
MTMVYETQNHWGSEIKYDLHEFRYESFKESILMIEASTSSERTVVTYKNSRCHNKGPRYKWLLQLLLQVAGDMMQRVGHGTGSHTLESLSTKKKVINCYF